MTFSESGLLSLVVGLEESSSLESLDFRLCTATFFLAAEFALVDFSPSEDEGEREEDEDEEVMDEEEDVDEEEDANRFF